MTMAAHLCAMTRGEREGYGQQGPSRQSGRGRASATAWKEGTNSHLRSTMVTQEAHCWVSAEHERAAEASGRLSPRAAEPMCAVHAPTGPSRWGPLGEGTTTQSSPPAAHALRALSHVHIVLIPQVRRQRPALAPPSWFLVQPRQSFLHKPLYPLVGMATAHANCGGNVSDRHPVREE